MDMNYKEIIDSVLANGVSKQATRFDANGVVIPVENGTIGTFCEIFQHDMSEGFPLTTLRKMPWKSICAELEMFIKGITNKSFLRDRKSKFWDYWCSSIHLRDNHVYDDKKYQYDDNDLGPLGYSHGWRNFGGLRQPIPTIHTTFDKTICVTTSNDKFVGSSFCNKYGEFIVTERIDSRKYIVKFKKTGYINEVSKNNIKNLQVKDPYYPIIYGVACFGETCLNKDNRRLRSLWNNIISRCYNLEDKDYPAYGGCGTYVSNDWLVFSNFEKEYPLIAKHELKEENPSEYTLDKDFLGGNCYSLKNCIFLSKKDQSKYRKKHYIYEGVDPNGRIYQFSNALEFAGKHNLDSTSISRVTNGEHKQHKGWFFKKQVVVATGYDQLQTIVNKLNTSPQDRRMVCSAWNPNEMNEAALPSCHYAWNVVVYGDKLNLVFHMRSADLLLGVGANIASYALLLELLAKESGLIPGELVGTFADCHIYENHLPAARELVQRSESALPTIKIKHKQDGAFDLFSWTHDEVELIGYNPQEKLDIGAVTV
jgi:thymidylate synthase